jgi:endonuclease YncB( thermonuclease family)
MEAGMKVLAALFSLLLGAAVFVFFLRPWEDSGQPSVAKAPEAAQVEVQQPERQAEQPNAQPLQNPDAEPKPRLLARERAEAERQAALGDDGGHAVTPQPETKRYFKVQVRDAGTLEVNVPNADPVVIRLRGIEAREADEDCARQDGTTWPCGAKAKAALALFIRSRAVTCTQPPAGGANEFAAQCSVMNQDLAAWLVRRGWAKPTDDAEKALAEALQAAQAERIGLWDDE